MLRFVYIIILLQNHSKKADVWSLQADVDIGSARRNRSKKAAPPKGG